VSHEPLGAPHRSHAVCLIAAPENEDRVSDGGKKFRQGRVPPGERMGPIAMTAKLQVQGSPETDRCRRVASRTNRRVEVDKGHIELGTFGGRLQNVAERGSRTCHKQALAQQAALSAPRKTRSRRRYTQTPSNLHGPMV